MTDLEKAQAVLKATNAGQDLPEHQQHIVMNALVGDLGPASRIVFDDLWEQIEVRGPAKPGDSR